MISPVSSGRLEFSQYGCRVIIYYIVQIGTLLRLKEDMTKHHAMTTAINQDSHPS